MAEETIRVAESGLTALVDPEILAKAESGLTESEVKYVDEKSF